ncbi:acyclic terpene utilization AtuA family protein [Roseomonas sp. 18066]|uniref:acyclic terpene utilization AtuA family protein n=1 Tax=Roseomonas sp. 18066 TaxID=2681412 RepID=UPI00135C8657|nr:acyclic terpene utilization AtuA family protein [Roseomonas sp. 18066]
MEQTLLRIGCGSGFSGDRLDAPGPVVDALIAAGGPAALMLEVLGERTLALAQRERLTKPEAGFEPALVALLRPILSRCVQHGIPIVTNGGAANPRGAADAALALARELGVAALRVAIVEGDDIRGSGALADLDPWEGDAGAVLDPGQVIAANVYLGAAPIADALRQGAQLVITGRCSDPALALGPMLAHFGWAEDDWDRLAAGTMAGHLLECGAQVTGGYFADPGTKDVEGMAEIGFPIAEISPDGSILITKPAGTGGLVDRRTVTEQLLYELHDPGAYLTPDVILDITNVAITEEAPDRVRVTGARGKPRPPTLKATVSLPGGWLGEGEISYGGPNCRARAELAGRTLQERLKKLGLEGQARLDLIGVVSVFGGDAGVPAGLEDLAPPDIRLRLAVATDDRATAESAVREVLSLYCCGPAGGGGVRSRVIDRIRTLSFLVPRERLSPRVTLLTLEPAA